eukprot:CAMPEP_0202968632 /NCGR_PEP_ID=MMETSP1396-20130829/13994_1 /ASSEMBLY_ACC=CAM_ASM_000872 /TAXON_ID= /ORGANISM="Pseudokeronopsis sp., Strain Brazil" /LENGTH=57 /DNA_ID=CAMNT_0049695155 /DNA_START=1624 /DNA_END=1797 /DNA_ORIENTATION=+
MSALQEKQEELEKVAITFVESGSEPELFKEIFPQWTNYEHSDGNMLEELSSESEEEG